MKRGKPVYVQKPLCNTLHETRMLTEYARRKAAHDADGHPGLVDPRRSATAKRSSAAASSARFARCTPSRTRAGATTSRSPEATDPVPAPFDWDDWLGVSAPRPFKKAVLPPGRMAAPRRVRHRHARRHGLPHLQPAVPRAEADLADRGHGLGSGADRGELGDEGARQADLSRVPSSPRARPSTSGGTTAASCRPTRIREPVGARFPRPGQHRRRHGRPDRAAARQRGSLRAAGREDGTRCRRSRCADRDHYARVHRRRARRRQAEVLGELRLRRPADRVGASSATSPRASPAKRSSSTRRRCDFQASPRPISTSHAPIETAGNPGPRAHSLLLVSDGAGKRS